MKIPLSKRLACCARYVHPGDRIADVGCDHGYLGIYLLKNGIASSVIAADIHEGPLHSAFVNAGKYGVREQMSFYLSDGAKKIPRQFDCLVCAGMGALTIISILEASPWLQDNQYRLILQCQSKTPLLRQYLSENGYCISKEAIVRDGKFLYTVMEVHWEPGHILSPGQCCISPALLESRQPELPEYYERIIKGLKEAVEGRGEEHVPFKAAALQELTQSAQFTCLMEDAYDNR